MSWPMMCNQLLANVFTRCFTRFFGWGYGFRCAIPLIVFDCERRVLQYQCAVALHVAFHRDVTADQAWLAVERRTGIWWGSEANGARHRQSRRTGAMRQFPADGVAGIDAVASPIVVAPARFLCRTGDFRGKQSTISYECCVGDSSDWSLAAPFRRMGFLRLHADCGTV